MKRSVVTGGAGFLGSHLCERLLAEGHEVVVLDNLDTGSLQNIEHIRDEAFDFRNVDLTDEVAVEGHVDYVFHLASPASPIDYLRLPLHTLKVGAYGTHHALGLAKFKRARLLLASTSEVYGDPAIHPQPETYWGNVNPIGPRGVYDEAKRYAEALAMAYHRQQGVDTAIARIFNTYGPRMRPNDGRAVPTFMRQAIEGKPITVFGSGEQTRSFCYVDDLIEGLFRLTVSGEHTPVNLGNPAELSLLDLAQAIVAVTGSRSPIVFQALPIDDPKVRCPDITKAMQLLDWRPTGRPAGGSAAGARLRAEHRESLDDGAERRRAREDPALRPAAGATSGPLSQYGAHGTRRALADPVPDLPTPAAGRLGEVEPVGAGGVGGDRRHADKSCRGVASPYSGRVPACRPATPVPAGDATLAEELRARWADARKEVSALAIDVIIVTYQSAAELADCLATMRAARDVARMIVVDNASTDGSAAAASAGGADVVIENDRNLGFARAVNIGLGEATADFVLLLNPDARLAPPALSRMHASLEQEPGAAIIAPLLRRGHRVTTGAGRSATVARRVGLCVPLVGRAPRFRPEYAPPADPLSVGRAVDVDYVFGAAMLLDRDFLASAKGLDERFFLFAEDEDICRRARAVGRRVLLDGRAVADHVGGASCADEAATEAQRLFSTYRLLAKWDGPRKASAYRRGVLAAFWFRVAAAHVGDGLDRRRAAGDSRTGCASTGRATSADLRRTSQLFDAAVRTGVDPLQPPPQRTPSATPRRETPS